VASSKSRLIIVPQYPTPLRYQEWWPERLVRGYSPHFEEVVLLNPGLPNVMAPLGSFSPAQQAIEYEAEQIKMFNDLALRKDDVLLLCDLSFPGLFASVLYHKRPSRCFAICHATSLNRYDYFAKFRKKGKWRVETGTSRIFDKVFVASEYHKEKLGWPNIDVIKFPLPDIGFLIGGSLIDSVRTRQFVSAARSGVQKVDKKLEKKLMELSGCGISKLRLSASTQWKHYYQFLQNGKFLIVTSREETYGYQVIDALMVGTIPIAPRAMSYPEILPDRYLYQPGDVDSLMETCKANQVGSPGLWEDTFIEHTAGKMLG
jgi:hypothetical protein